MSAVRDVDDTGLGSALGFAVTSTEPKIETDAMSDFDAEEMVYKKSKKKRRCGVTARDAYERSRFEIATPTEKNLTEADVMAQLLAEEAAIEKDEPLPPRKPVERYRPIMKVLDERGANKVSVDAVDDDESEADAADDAARSLLPSVDGDKYEPRMPEHDAELMSKYKLDPLDGKPIRSGIKMRDGFNRRRTEMRPAVTQLLDGFGNKRMENAATDEPDDRIARIIANLTAHMHVKKMPKPKCKSSNSIGIYESNSWMIRSGVSNTKSRNM